jgi:predicted adenine nucleotide alpha hydrolase (AANH) superfamily ATPase
MAACDLHYGAFIYYKLVFYHRKKNKKLEAEIIMESKEKEVYYDQYCGTCVYADQVDKDGLPVEKCEECLSTPTNIDSHRPINYKEKRK